MDTSDNIPAPTPSPDDAETSEHATPSGTPLRDDTAEDVTDAEAALFNAVEQALATPEEPRTLDDLLADLGTLPADETAPALQQLGRLPLEKGKFPVMGYLATVYDHLAGNLPDDE